MDNLHIKAGLTENDRQSFLEQLLQKIIDVDAEAQKMTEKSGQGSAVRRSPESRS